jgi:hyperosmotically inducible periplasmic protein
MMNRYLKLVAVSLVVGTVSMVGSAFGAKSAEKTPIADSWVTARAKIVLAADGRVKGHQVSVETNKGVVKLRGKVDDAQAKKVAKDVVEVLEGVKRVDNELQVVAPAKRDSVTESDEAITARVKDQIVQDAAIMKNNRLKDANIGVVTNAGVVSLSGEVPDIVVSAQASWTAWQVHGVKSVKNDLTLKTR